MISYINKIDDCKEPSEILHWLAEACKHWADDKITTKQYMYIKGYADCKIKQLGKN